MKKLQKYLTLSAATLTSGVIHAGIIYTDVNPDVTLDIDGDFFDIDMDGNNVADYTVAFEEQAGYWGTWRLNRISGQLGNSMAGYPNSSYYGGSNFAYAYFYSASIGPGNNWIGSNAQLGWYWNSGYGGSAYSSGPWSGVQDQFVGVKFGINGSTHYGWIRLDVSANFDQVIIKDFAYEDTPDASINAGATLNPSLIASNIVAIDNSNFHNGADLQVSFDHAPDEAGISEYRIMAIKSAQAFNFSSTIANGVSSYVSVIPDGQNHTTTFNQNSKDSDGDLIKEDVPYYIFILSVPDFDTLFSSSLSEASNQITLLSNVGISEFAFDDLKIKIVEKQLTISSPTNIDNITVMDEAGKVIYSEKNIQNKVINLENNSSGLVILQIEKNGEIKTEKFFLN